MKKQIISLILALGLVLSLVACGEKAAPAESSVSAEASTPAEDGKVASSGDMAEVIEVVEEGMEPVYGTDLKDGTYSVTVDSSSPMFNITDCQLTVENGEMTAVMTMGGTGYLHIFMGTGAEAEQADESEYIPFVENAEGAHTFTVPVEALDMGIDCTAFSKRKEMWYDRTILFRVDSLPMEAFADGVVATVESLGIEDGVYTAEVALEGGSGRASVESPARLTVEGGVCTAEIVWSSSSYDFMVVDGQQYDTINEDGNSAFSIPVSGFDYKMAVQADTTAMSKPYLIDYTLCFDSATIQAAE